MPKVFLDCDERYPDWSVRLEAPGSVAELSAAELADWERVSREYGAWQAKLAKLAALAKANRRARGTLLTNPSV